MQYTRMVSLGLIILGLCGVFAKAAEKDTRMNPVIPNIEALPCAVPPIVDGVLTDACWQASAMISNLHVFNQPGRTRPAQAWVARDDAWLYVAIAIPHPAPKHIKQTVTEHNGPVESDDSVEIFLDPGTGGVLYFQYKLNALNVGAEKYVTRKADQTCPGGFPWRSGTAQNAQGWSAEVAIPLAFLAAYGDLSKCRLNLNVNLVIPRIDPYQVRVGEDKECLSWAPVRAGFHEPERFGYLQGLAVTSIRAPFFPQFSDLTVKPYQLIGKNYAYGLTMKVTSAFAQAGTATLEITDRPVDGKASVITQRVEVAGRDARELRISVPVASMAERTVEVRLKNPATGEIFQRALMGAKALSALNLITCYLDRTYYTTESEALAVCAFSLPSEELVRMKVVARGSGKILAEAAPASPVIRVAIPLKNLPEGASALQVELCRGNGDKVAGQGAVLIKRLPAAGREWKIDRVNRVLLRDGQPFFGFGMVAATLNENTAKDIAAAGLNHVCVLGGNTNPEQAIEHRRLAEKYGLYLIDYLDGYVNSTAPIAFKHSLPDPTIPEPDRSRQFSEVYSNKLALVQYVIKSLADSPRVMGYFTIDEPGGMLDIRDMPQRGRDLYRAANAADGYHPLFVNFSSYINEGAEWTDWTDVLGTDPYWTPGGALHRGTPNFVSKITRLTDDRARPNRLPTWIIPQAGYWSGNYRRPIRPQEQFCQTYLALIHGAKCITYFSYSTIVPQSNYDAIRDLAGQMEQLGPVMTTPDVPQRVTYAPVAWDPDNALYPSAQVALRSHPDGGYVLLCANSKYYPVDAVFRLNGLAMTSGVVREMFEPKREHPLKDGAFRDSLEPFGVRAYRIGDQTTDDGNQRLARRSSWREGGSEVSNQQSEMVEIAVTATDHPEKVQAEEPEAPCSGRPGKKNLAQNPSFEEMSLPGLPDYYYTAQGYDGLPPARTGTHGARYECVTNQPYHGRYCVRMEGHKPLAQVRFRLAPKVDQPTQFVLSIYMRADRDGVQAGLASLCGQIPLPGWQGTTVKLSTQWQRVSITGIIPPGLEDYNQFVVFAPTDNSTVWFDAVQLEKGAEPTEFEP